MSEQDDGATPGGEGYVNGADTQPAIGVISQYVKDLSFENPNAPAIYQQQQQAQPAIDIQFNIGANAVADGIHEVELKIEVKAQTEDDQTVFLVELAYAGLFGIRNVPDEHIQPFLLGEAPRILFPFARRIVADAIRDGGFPPLLLEPIDFQALYLQQVQAQGVTGSIEGIGQA